MNNITFENEMVKGRYQEVLKSNRGLSGVILKLLMQHKDIKIKAINDIEFGIQIVLEGNNGLININVDLLKNKIYVEQNDMTYQEIYNNHPQKFVSPTGYLFKNDDREIVERLTFRLNTGYDIKHYELTERDMHYVIIVDGSNKNFDENSFIEKILYNPVKYNNIRDLFIIINDIAITNRIDVKIGDSKGSTIVISDGVVTNYTEFFEEDGHYNKIYLENGEFHINKTVKETYRDHLTSYVKKIGEYHGKEKRKN